MPDAAPQTAQKIIVHAKDDTQCGGEQKLPALQTERKLHLSEQTVKKAACFLQLLIGERIDIAGHGNIAAVDGKRFQMQICAADNQNAACCVQYDGVFIKSFYLVHTADGQLFPIFQSQVMRLGAIDFVCHAHPSAVYIRSGDGKYYGTSFGSYNFASSTSDSSTRP